MSRRHQFTKEGHDFGNVFRTKPTARTRLFYIASSRLQVVRVLYLGMLRKEGDKKDAYKEFSRLLKAGRFDADFAALGVGRPAG
ncbi:MAG TPA: type II toxin-antitoxin system YhaV family toxin [Polyangiaceae bacterium]